MKRLCNLMLAGMLIVTLGGCGKQARTESSVDKAAEQHGKTEHEQSATSETIQTDIQIEEGDNVVTEEISFNFETKTVLLNSGYKMPIYGIGTYSLTGDTCVESVITALNRGVRLIDTAYMYHNDVICCEL